MSTRRKSYKDTSPGRGALTTHTTERGRLALKQFDARLAELEKP